MSTALDGFGAHERSPDEGGILYPHANNFVETVKAATLEMLAAWSNRAGFNSKRLGGSHDEIVKKVLVLIEKTDSSDTPPKDHRTVEGIRKSVGLALAKLNRLGGRVESDGK